MDEDNASFRSDTLKGRFSVLFNKDYLSDVQFIVGIDSGTRRFPAHKLVLSTGSSVFNTMFYGSLPETSGVIDVPDVEPAAFLQLLRYTESINVKLLTFDLYIYILIDGTFFILQISVHGHFRRSHKRRERFGHFVRCPKIRCVRVGGVLRYSSAEEYVSGEHFHDIGEGNYRDKFDGLTLSRTHE